MSAEDASPALGLISYGMYVIGSKNGDELNGMTANWLTQVSFNPRMVALAVENDARTLRNIKADRVFSVNVVRSDGLHLIEKFVQPQERVGNKLGGVEFFTATTGAPILREALAWFECRVVNLVETGDHTLVIGEVVDGGTLREGDPLTLRDLGWEYGG